MSRFWKIALIVIAVLVVGGVAFRLLHKPEAANGGYGHHREGGQGQQASQGGSGQGQSGGNGQDNAPVPVTVESTVKQNVPVYLTALGTVTALNNVTVNPEIGGQLWTINFKEGQAVKKGDVIAQIDPRTYQAAYDQAVAKQKQDEASLATAISTLDRNQQLVGKGYVAALDMDTYRNNVAQLKATVIADEAAARSAKVSLDFTRIISPIDGVAGIRNVDPGNVVTTTTSIVTLTQIQPIYVIFSLPEQNLETVRDAFQNGANKLEVIALDRTDSHPLDTSGFLQVVDNQIDTTTGTFKLRAQFNNPDSKLWQGQFVNVQLRVQTVAGGLVIPSQAVQRGPDGDYVYKLQSDQTVAMQPVTVAGEVGDSHVMISKGLDDGDQVVTEGQFRLKPGSKVQALKPGQVPAAPAASDADKKKWKKQGGGRRGNGGGGGG
ncbi:efflux RND transporter periplasmic adaptor subunit [Dyella caseinilytica]|uniref:Efflux RND transporter periplasmic adaptor subunit n=1 Tax=Dyella caseinilytica TaxID=1849581 RepID=A0ABX7GSD8_9GAMM|nr:efflux RND transporter periplasmic adaptor subunit [Dyella caseinilytica]QRN53312.1 efflux RND transporter periplasmic adaptor subunit [Dyella caseinilytica]GGA13132.1 membrane protein [Dyella caseinilytica]